MIFFLEHLWLIPLLITVFVVIGLAAIMISLEGEDVMVMPELLSLAFCIVSVSWLIYGLTELGMFLF